MITANIAPWTETNGIKQIGTTWTIAYDEEMTDVIFKKYYTDISNMYVLMAFIEVQADQTVWVQATRHFNNGNLDYAMKPIPKLNIKEKISAQLQQEDIFIDTPMVTVNEAELKDISLGYFTVKTSKYRGNYSSHLYTNWIVKDEEDNVVLVSLKDETNLREFRINKDVSLMGKNKLTVYAIHGTNNTVESKPGKAYVVLGKLNFNIISELNNVLPQTNYPLRIKKVDDNSPSNITRIAITNITETETMWETQIEDEVEEVIIPWYVLFPNTKYTIVITATNSIGMFVEYKKQLVTRGDKLVDVTNIYTQCNFNLRKIENNNTLLKPRFSTVELLDRSILIPDGNTLVKYHYNYDTDKLTKGDSIAEGVILPSDNNKNMYIKYLENNFLLVDGLNEDNKPTFQVYYHNMSNNTFSLLNTVVRDHEVEPIGITNAIVQITDYEFVYLPFNGDALYKYDIRKNEVEKLSAIPDENNTVEKNDDTATKPRYGLLIKVNSNRLLVVAGDTFQTHTYSIKGNYFIPGITISPGSFIGRPLQTRQLLNGSTIIYKTNYNDDDKEISMLYFNYVESKIERLSIQFDKDRFPTGSIGLANGDTLLYTFNSAYRNKPENTKLQIFN